MDLSCAYTPQQNGVAERKNRTIICKAKSMMAHASLSKKFWAEAVSTAVFLMNRSPSRSLVDKTPFEVWTGKRPNLQNLKVFGCVAMVLVPKVKRKKWDDKSKELMFVGYSETQKGWRLMDPKSNKITVSRDVEFLENQMFCNRDKENKVVQKENKDFFYPIIEDEEDETKEEETQEEEETKEEENNDDKKNGNGQVDVDVDDSFADAVSEESDLLSDQERQVIEPKVQQRPKRKINLPGKYNDFVMFTSFHSMDEEEPDDWMDALNSSSAIQWNEAMQQEIDSLNKSGAWSLVKLPEGKTPIQARWVFKIKRKQDGSIDRYKARLVARGFMQKQGIDYSDTYAPVVRYTTIRLLLSLALRYNAFVYHIDVETAFLNGDLDEEIYVAQPEPFVNKNCEKMVMKLHSAIYGLKQGSKKWNEKLNEILTSLGFTQLVSDQCVFIFRDNERWMIIAIYVDDEIIITNSEQLKQQIVEKLRLKLTIKDLGELKCFLNIAISREQDKLTLSQEHYIEQILKKFNMDDCTPERTPLDCSTNLSSLDLNNNINLVPSTLTSNTIS